MPKYTFSIQIVYNLVALPFSFKASIKLLNAYQECPQEFGPWKCKVIFTKYTSNKHDNIEELLSMHVLSKLYKLVALTLFTLGYWSSG